MCRFRHALMKAPPRTKSSISQGQGYRIDSGPPPDARNCSEIRVSNTAQVLYTRKMTNFLKAQIAFLCRFPHFAGPGLSESTRVHRQMPEIVVRCGYHLVQMLSTRKLAKFSESTDRLPVYVLFKDSSRTNRSISRGLFYPNRFGSTARCPKL